MFRIASSQAYGDALLKYSRMIVTCTTINTLSPEQRSAGMAQEKAASSAINAEGEAKKAAQAAALEEVPSEEDEVIADENVSAEDALEAVALQRDEAEKQAAEISKEKVNLAKNSARVNKLLKEVEEKKAAQAALKPIDPAWACKTNPSSKGKIVAVQEAGCDATVAFSSNTDTPLKGKCDIEFRAESARRYGTELLKFSDKVRKCSTTAPVPASVMKAQKKVSGAAKDGGKTNSHKQLEKLLKVTGKVTQQFWKYIVAEKRDLKDSGKQNYLEVLEKPAQVAESALSELVDAKQQVRDANKKFKVILKERVMKERKAAGLTGPPPSDNEWVCDSDPSQTAKIKATVGGETCDAAIQFATSSGALDATCKQQFSGDSAEMYGKAQLHLYKVLSKCLQIPEPGGALAKQAKAAEKTSKAAKEVEKKQAIEQDVKLGKQAAVQAGEKGRVKGMEVASKNAFELTEKDREKAQENTVKAGEKRSQAQGETAEAIKKGTCRVFE